MNDRSRRVLRLVAGMYLIYLSFNLISGQLKSATSNAIVAWAAAVGFGLFGIYLIVNFIKTSMKDYREQEEMDEETVEEIEEKEEEE